VLLAFSPDGLVVASGLSDGEIVLWDMAGGRDPITLMGHEEYVARLAFSHDGRVLISASWDKTVRLWDLSQGERCERVRVCVSRRIHGTSLPLPVITRPQTMGYRPFRNRSERRNS
jgi:WD40 repeat protein